MLVPLFLLYIRITTYYKIILLVVVGYNEGGKPWQWWLGDSISNILCIWRYEVSPDIKSDYRWQLGYNMTIITCSTAENPVDEIVTIIFVIGL